MYLTSHELTGEAGAKAMSHSSLKEIAEQVQKLEETRARDPGNETYVRWYAARRALSNFTWDLFTAHCYQVFTPPPHDRWHRPALSTSGVVTGALPTCRGT
jgi:hypothetical protein